MPNSQCQVRDDRQWILILGNEMFGFLFARPAPSIRTRRVTGPVFDLGASARMRADKRNRFISRTLPLSPCTLGSSRRRR
jgi:hypothetical protein